MWILVFRFLFVCFMLSETSASFCSFLRPHKPPILMQKSLWAGIFQVFSTYTAEVGHGPIPLHSCHLDEVPFSFHPLEQIRLCETQKEGNSWFFLLHLLQRCTVDMLFLHTEKLWQGLHHPDTKPFLCAPSAFAAFCYSSTASAGHPPASAGRYFCITPFSVTSVVQICPIQYTVLLFPLYNINNRI